MSCPWREKLAAAYLRVRARQYAKTLRPGDRILEDTDGKVIEDFRQHLPWALAEQQLRAEPLADGSGFVVHAAGDAWESETTQEMPLPQGKVHTTCNLCGASIFECEHQAQWNFRGGPVPPMAFREWGRA